MKVLLYTFNTTFWITYFEWILVVTPSITYHTHVCTHVYTCITTRTVYMYCVLVHVRLTVQVHVGLIVYHVVHVHIHTYIQVHRGSPYIHEYVLYQGVWYVYQLRVHCTCITFPFLNISRSSRSNVFDQFICLFGIQLGLEWFKNLESHSLWTAKNDCGNPPPPNEAAMNCKRRREEPSIIKITT